jgi:hypothetical protein
MKKPMKKFGHTKHQFVCFSRMSNACFQITNICRTHIVNAIQLYRLPLEFHLQTSLIMTQAEGKHLIIYKQIPVRLWTSISISFFFCHKILKLYIKNSPLFKYSLLSYRPRLEIYNKIPPQVNIQQLLRIYTMDLTDFVETSVTTLPPTPTISSSGGSHNFIRKSLVMNTGYLNFKPQG